jgi:MoaA/NifB/PqqE/SkfB family radical SAM enzyme
MTHVRIEHSHEHHNEWFVVNWCLGNTCTYSCSYCPKGLHDGSVPFPSAETVTKFIDSMSSHALLLGKKLYVELTGGEVTVWKDFLTVAEYCRDKGVKLGFISNGSRTVRWWEENRHLFDHVCLSFHPEEGDSDHFLRVVETVARHMRVHVNVMMLPEQFDYCYSIAQKVKDVGDVSLALQPLIVDFGDTLYNYSAQQRLVFDNQYDLVTKHIKWTTAFPYYRGAMRAVNEDGTIEVKAAHRFVAQSQNNWSGWDCYAGVEQIIVDMDGTIHRGWCKVGRHLGTIYAPRLTAETVVCNKAMCHCNYDIMATKVQRTDTGGRRVIPVSVV